MRIEVCPKGTTVKALAPIQDVGQGVERPVERRVQQF